MVVIKTWHYEWIHENLCSVACLSCWASRYILIYKWAIKTRHCCAGQESVFILVHFSQFDPLKSAWIMFLVPLWRSRLFIFISTLGSFPSSCLHPLQRLPPPAFPWHRLAVSLSPSALALWSADIRPPLPPPTPHVCLLSLILLPHSTASCFFHALYILLYSRLPCSSYSP